MGLGSSSRWKELGMNAARLVLRAWLCGGLMILTDVSRADDSPKPDANLEIIPYKTPAGWKVSEQAGQPNPQPGLTSPHSYGAQQASILILLTPPLERGA